MALLGALVSWLHILSAAISIVLGALILIASKGTSSHTLLGRWYFYLMLLNNVTALMIYNASGRWFFPHSLAVATLIVIIPGFLITKAKHLRHWLKLHIACLVISYYLLIGGAINEAFLHIPSLKAAADKSMHRGMAHFFSQVFFIGLIIFYLLKYKRRFVGRTS